MVRRRKRRARLRKRVWLRASFREMAGSKKVEAGPAARIWRRGRSG